MTDIRVPVDGADPSVERNLVDQLEGPYPGTVRRVVVPLAGTGAAVVDWTSRHPLLTVVLRRDLAEETVRVTVTVDPGGAGERALPPVVFAAWSAAGASVPAYVPDTADEPLVASFAVAVTAEQAVDGAAATAVTGAALTGLVELAVLEGNLGRLLYLVSYEKHRLRRAAREVHAYRTLAHARRDALDRIGADVGVARFVDELVHEPTNGEVYARRLARRPASRTPRTPTGSGSTAGSCCPPRARYDDCSTAPARTPTRTPGSSPTCPAAHGSRCARTTTGSRWRSGWSPPAIRSTARTSSPNCAATVSCCPRTPRRTTQCTPAGPCRPTG